MPILGVFGRGGRRLRRAGGRLSHGTAPRRGCSGGSRRRAGGRAPPLHCASWRVGGPPCHVVRERGREPCAAGASGFQRRRPRCGRQRVRRAGAAWALKARRGAHTEARGLGGLAPVPVARHSASALRGAIRQQRLKAQRRRTRRRVVRPLKARGGQGRRRPNRRDLREKPRLRSARVAHAAHRAGAPRLGFDLITRGFDAAKPALAARALGPGGLRAALPLLGAAVPAAAPAHRSAAARPVKDPPPAEPAVPPTADWVGGVAL